MALADDPAVLARVGDITVKAEDIQPLIDNLDAGQKKSLVEDPSPLYQSIRSLIMQRLLVKEALSKQWDKKADVAAQLEQARQAALAQSYLQSLAPLPAGFPGEADLNAAYEANKAKLAVPRQFQLAQIFIALRPDADKASADAAQGRLDAVRKNLSQSGVDFAAFARASSDDKASAARGGEIGWVAEAQIQPELRAKVVALGKNAISDPIKLADGWHLFKVLDIKEAHTASLDEVRDQLARELRAQKAQALQQAYLATLFQNNPAAINQIALAQLLGKAATK